MARILVIDDDEKICDILSRQLQWQGYEVAYALSLSEGLKKAASEYDVILLDVNLPDGNGLEAIPQFRNTPSCPEVIIFTGEGNPDGAELAIKSGAWDYIEKPPSVEELTLPLMRAIQYREEKGKSPADYPLRLDGVVGKSEQLKRCISKIGQAAASEVNVLISGGTGTGKELFARAIHENSNRSEGPFIVVDCAALPETLVESVLFGHEKGAFTHADRRREGLIHQANSGTLFLDEVGELPLQLQKPFLRVLQEHRFRPIGSNREITSDFRLLAATNRDLDHMVGSGRFRKDLLFRLKTLVIDLPPLRQRAGDIEELTRYYVRQRCDTYGLKTKDFSPEFFDCLKVYEWPGNVRELINVLEQALINAGADPVLFTRHLPDELRINYAQSTLQKEEDPPAEAEERVELSGKPLPPLRVHRQGAIAAAENRYLFELMSTCRGDVPEACRIAGVSRARLYALLKKHNLSPKEAAVNPS